MRSNREMLLCYYFYDPLDRLTAYTPSEQASTQRYYLNDRLASEIQGAVQYSVMQFDDHLLAQQRRLDGTVETNVLATDLQRSVLAVLDSKSQSHSLFYAPYGHRPMESGLLSLLGFNGERRDSVTGHYLLGNGYRAFNPVLMRFNSPDSWSPFGAGGLNAYAYCEGDPVNRVDPSGHVKLQPRLSRSSSAPELNIYRKKSLTLTSESNFDYIGIHGSAADNSKSLLAGLSPQHMNSSGGLSTGRGFYVSPARQTAVDFSEVAALDSESGKPQLFEVHVKNFSAMRPGHHYRFSTMGEGGLKPRALNEMEIVLRESIYKYVSIRTMGVRKRPVLPKASEAPF
jgi:RHS repeat-associated protein